MKADASIAPGCAEGFPPADHAARNACRPRGASPDRDRGAVDFGSFRASTKHALVR